MTTAPYKYTNKVQKTTKAITIKKQHLLKNKDNFKYVFVGIKTKKL